MKNVAIDGRLYNILFNMDKLYLTEKAPQLMSVYYQSLASSFREENIFCVSIVLFLLCNLLSFLQNKLCKLIDDGSCDKFATSHIEKEREYMCVCKKCVQI